MDDNTKKELQSAAFERLISHLREDVQNIDLMNLAGFVETAYQNGREEGQKKGITISDPEARDMFMACLILSGKKSIKSNYLL